MTDDVKIIQRGINSAGTGDDIYILSDGLIDAGAEIVITDSQGVNTIQCVSGLTLASSRVTENALMLVTDNGAEITVLGASAMQFQVGGDVLQGEPGVMLSYDEFVVQELGSTVPAAGTINDGPSAVIGQQQYAGKVIDGFIKDAFVFADANGNGVYDEGEVSTTSDSLGNFELEPGAKGDLISIGGTDISTGLAFTGSMSAPSGADVITPSTTLINHLVEQGMSPQDAQKTVNQALGLPDDTDLMNIDPLTDLDNNDDQGADNDLMLQIHAANLKLATAMTQMGAVIKGASGDATSDQQAFDAVTQALAEKILSGTDGGNNAPEPLDLTDNATIRETLNTASGQIKQAQQDNDDFDDSAFDQNLEQAREGASEIITTTTGKIQDAMDDPADREDPIAALTEAVKIQGVAHGQGKEDLESGARQGNTDEFLDDYSEEELSNKADSFDEPDNVVTGEDDDGTTDPVDPTDPTDPTDPVDPTPPSGGGGGGGGGGGTPPLPKATLSLVNDTGLSATDRVSQVGTVQVNDLKSGKDWQYSLDFGHNWTDGDSSGRFTLANNTTYEQGAIQVRYVETPTTVSGRMYTEVVIDNQAPTTFTAGLLSDTGISNSDNLTNNASGLTGTADAGSEITIRDGSAVLGTVRADDQGVWTLKKDLSSQSGETLRFDQTDLAGNSMGSGNVFSFTLDNDGPSASYGSTSTHSISSASVLTLNSGESVSALSTQDGEAWLVLSSESPASYSDLTALETAGKAVKVTVTANTATPVSTATLAEGNYKLITSDNAGNLSTVAQHSSHDVTVTLADTVAPGAPTLSLQATSDSGSSNSDHISMDTTPTIRINLPNVANTPAATDARTGDTVTLYTGGSTTVGSTTLDRTAPERRLCGYHHQ